MGLSSTRRYIGEYEEPLYIVNRSGNRPSSEGAPEYLNLSIALCRSAGWKDILLRGDTAFALTKYFDDWDNQGVRFVFGYRASKTVVAAADVFEDSDYEELVKCEYKNLRLEKEEIVEFDYQPKAANRHYRVVVLAKTIAEEKGQITLGFRNRYFFYITNDWNMSMEQVIAESNNRCDQENIIAEQKSGTRAFTAPLNTLEANWAYMVIASLAWSLKAWFALLLPVEPGKETLHLADRKQVLHMEFRSFVQRIILIPAQIVSTAADSSTEFSRGALISPSFSDFSTLFEHQDRPTHWGPGRSDRMNSTTNTTNRGSRKNT